MCTSTPASLPTYHAVADLLVYVGLAQCVKDGGLCLLYLKAAGVCSLSGMYAHVHFLNLYLTSFRVRTAI